MKARGRFLTSDTLYEAKRERREPVERCRGPRPQQPLYFGDAPFVATPAFFAICCFLAFFMFLGLFSPMAPTSYLMNVSIIPRLRHAGAPASGPADTMTASCAMGTQGFESWTDGVRLKTRSAEQPERVTPARSAPTTHEPIRAKASAKPTPNPINHLPALLLGIIDPSRAFANSA